MKVGRPRSLQVKKSYKRKRGAAARRAKNPKQIPATMARRRKRKRG